MYQNPNFLGGNAQNPPMPGAQFGSSFGTGAGLPQQQQPPQPSPFAPQPTGFQPAPLQQQYTGFPGLQQPQQTAQLQPQFTGFPGSQPMGSAVPPVPAIPQQFQQQFQQQQQQQPSPFAAPVSQPAPQSMASLAPPPPPVKPQPTGFKEMAASFQTAKPAASTPAAPRKVNPVPNIRLSFITAQDQAKFETLFKSAVGENSTTMSGEQARDLLLRSKLDGDTLSHIWYDSWPAVWDTVSTLGLGEIC
jgi:hypothetical protein